MPESRDRLSRPVDIAALFARRRAGGFGVLIDQEEDLFRSPVRRQPPAATTTVVRTPAGFGNASARRGGGGGGGGGRFSTENSVARGSARRGRGRGRSGVLPSWYPRTPLRDITAIARAIERRRARLRDGEGQDSESPSQDQGILEPSTSDHVIRLEHETHAVSPHTAIKRKQCPLSVGRVPKILLSIANQDAEESDCLTPQRKLLNSIDTVEKVVTEELQKLKRTPAAKLAERERRVRTLMSMR